MRGLIRRLLEAFDIKRVRDAVDGADGLRALSDIMPDIVVTDYAMQPMNGIEFVRQVRLADDTPNPYLPIIMVTGYTEKHRIVRARDSGVTEIVAKPVSSLSLYSRIVAVIERPRPFVRTANFFGPDRRRRQVPFKGEERRGSGISGVAGDDDTFDIEFG